VAKTVRDRVMHRLAVRHPGYGWHTNVGYGTPEHQQGLQRLGPCVHHRRSFAPVAQLAFL
jgi:ribonuclease HII